jgi:hypothetical protein
MGPTTYLSDGYFNKIVTKDKPSADTSDISGARPLTLVMIFHQSHY